MSSKTRLRFRVENRPYDCHRPEGCTSLIIEHKEWEGNEFGLWVPERAPGWSNWVQKYQDWEILSVGEAQWRYSLEGIEFVSTISIDHDSDCLWYSYAITNTSDTPLRNVDTQTCFHLVNAPEFISIHGERYWACLDDRWTTTDTVPRHKSLDPRRVSFLRHGLRKERTIVHERGFPSSTMPEAACHPLLIAESFDGKKSVGITCKDMRSLFNNNDYILRCIHSEPLPIKEIASKETAYQDGVILFCDGNRQKLLEKYNRVVPSNWWRG